MGDPRDAEQFDRLKDLAEDPHGMYDCTHCFKCIEACPKGVAPMSQIMRLRRRAGDDHGIDDANNGHRHEMAFVKNIRRNGLLHEADLLPDSYGGKFHPRAVPELLDSLPVITRALLRRKVTPKGALVHSHKAPKDVKAIFEAVEGREDRVELNLYLTGYDEDLVDAPGAPTDAPLTGAGDGAQNAPESRRAGHEPRGVPHPMKVAYWPGCVSRGFTPELHGSMAKIAPLLDLELVELDRASCCGAGVIAEHNQELADTLNARTFALAQDVPGRRADDEHLLDLPGRPDRVPGAPGRERGLPRADQRDAAGGVGAVLREGPDEQELPLAAGGGARPRRPDRAGQASARPTSASARSTAATSCAPPTGWGSTTSCRATRTSASSSRPWAAPSSSTRAPTSAAASRSSR